MYGARKNKSDEPQNECATDNDLRVPLLTSSLALSPEQLHNFKLLYYHVNFILLKS